IGTSGDPATHIVETSGSRQRRHRPLQKSVDAVQREWGHDHAVPLRFFQPRAGVHGHGDGDCPAESELRFGLRDQQQSATHRESHAGYGMRSFAVHAGSNSLRPNARRGAVAVLMAIILPVLLLCAAMAINVAYMEMSRQELRVACDSAAKAALIHLGKTQDQTASRSFARTISNMNLVAGQAPNIPDSVIEFGNATKNSQGVYAFSPGVTPLNSTRVTAAVSRPLLMNSLLPLSTFSTSETSLCVRAAHDIVLVLDRSASMAFDLSNAEFSYPPDRKAGTVVQSYFTSPS